MSRERTSVPCLKGSAVGEHVHCNGDNASGARCLSFENPIAINFEIQEELARDDEKGSEKIDLKGTSNTSITVHASCWPKRTNKFKKYCEWTVIWTVIVVIWGLLTLPTIYYHIPQDDPVALRAPINGTNNFDQCFPETYTGSVCRSALETRQKCISDRCGSTNIFVWTLSSQESLESQISSLLDGLQLLNPSPECTEVVGPFLCVYYFGLCDSSGELYLPSSGECETLTTETCAREFLTAVSVLGSANLPQCNTLSPTEIDCNGVCVEDEDSKCNATYMYNEVGSGLSDSRESNCTSRMVNTSDTVIEFLAPFEDSMDDNASSSNSTESPMAEPITCSQGFYLDNESSICRAECCKWENLPQHVELTTRVVARFGAVVYIISGSVLLVLSCVHHKRMFKFPAVFVIYEMFPLGLFEVFLLIAFTDTEGLFCSKRDVIGSVEDSTVFCNIQGVVFHYIALQQTLLWLFHILVVFWTVKFPMHAKIFKNKRYFRYIHFIMLVLAIVLPCIPLAAVLGTGGSVLGSFPPFQCFARNSDVIYYTFILPASIMMGVGITLIILILHVLIHVTALRRKDSLKDQDLRTQGSLCSQLYVQITRLVKLHSAELKFLMVSCYYVVFAVFIVTTFTITNVQNRMQFISEITDYFACEATGRGNECDRSFAELSGEIFTVLSLILVGLFPIVNLAYVVNIQELKRMAKYCPKNKRQLLRSSIRVISSGDTRRSYISSEF